MSDVDLVEVYLAKNSHQAHFLRNMLADAGIEARVFGELATLGMRPGEEAGPCLWVRERDRLRARQILEKWDEAQSRRDPPPESRPRSDVSVMAGVLALLVVVTAAAWLVSSLILRIL